MRSLVKLIKETASKKNLPVGPLINYQPPGTQIIINPILDTNINAPAGIKPIETK